MVIYRHNLAVEIKKANKWIQLSAGQVHYLRWSCQPIKANLVELENFKYLSRNDICFSFFYSFFIFNDYALFTVAVVAIFVKQILHIYLKK